MEAIEIRPLAEGKYRVVVGNKTTKALESCLVVALVAELVTPEAASKRQSLTLLDQEE